MVLESKFMLLFACFPALQCAHEIPERGQGVRADDSALEAGYGFVCKGFTKANQSSAAFQVWVWVCVYEGDEVVWLAQAFEHLC